MNIQTAKYHASEGANTSINVTLTDGKVLLVPIAAQNSEYIEIMRQVDAGELTIADAD
jgi:hypothetical protein